MYSIRWDRVQRRNCNIQVRVTLLDEEGKVFQVTRQYIEWIGVCTNNIHRVVTAIKQHFPNDAVSYEYLSQAKKILPYFENRLKTGKLDYRQKPFYKVYTTASHVDVGRMFRTYKIGYFEDADWLVRIYIDMCSRFDTYSFYYKWYTVSDTSTLLLESFQMLKERTDVPDWTIAAFDLETVPLVGNHIPMGLYPTDRIVMIGLYKWNRRQGVRKWILYLLPDGMDPLPDFKYGYRSEAQMLNDFHALLQDAQVITGYNINGFDFPCIFARLVWLQQATVLSKYSSFTVGQDLITTFDKKIVLDLYHYFKTFSQYNLPSFKLDDVANIKLGGESKIPIKSIGIWSWYTETLTREIFHSGNVEECFQVLHPPLRASQFGTFRMYLDYCLKDTELVYQLFEKETVLSFLVERANFTSLNAVEALHFGNSRFLLELFKTSGTRLGYFFNASHFLGDRMDRHQYLLGDKYQGGLNYCLPERVYEDVSIMDFTSMYPSTLVSSNLCYGTCTILTRDEWLSRPFVQQLINIPYRQHYDVDFERVMPVGEVFSYPRYNPDQDDMVIVINPNTEGFLPSLMKHFLKLRIFHQKEWKRTKNVYHYNIQLGTKILLNSLYGVMGTKESRLAYLPIAISIVTLSRNQLLGSYYFLKNNGYEVCYADTDSLMVQGWPHNNCDLVNQFLNISNVELKYEERAKRLMVISKKRYVYQQADDTIVPKCFQKKVNPLVKFMSIYILEIAWKAVCRSGDDSASYGWIVWVDVLLQANYMCRDPTKYSIYRKMKPLEEYKSHSCAAFLYVNKYPEKANEYVEYTYSRADVGANEALKWVVDAEDCRWVNYEQLFVSQKKIFCSILNLAFWHLPDPTAPCDAVLNTMRWNKFVRTELKHKFATGNNLLLLIVPGVKYTFYINDHLFQEKRARGRKRKTIETGI